MSRFDILQNASYKVFCTIGMDAMINGVKVHLQDSTNEYFANSSGFNDQGMSFNLHVLDFKKLKLKSPSDLRNKEITFLNSTLYGESLKIIQATIVGRDLINLKTKS